MSEERRGRMRNLVWGSGFGRAGEREVGELMIFEATDVRSDLLKILTFRVTSVGHTREYIRQLLARQYESSALGPIVTILDESTFIDYMCATDYGYLVN